MKLSSRLVTLNLSLLIVLFTYLVGYVSHREKFFPYHQIEATRNFIFPPKVNNSRKNNNNNQDKPRFSYYYYHKRSIFEDFGDQADVVFLGDSITDYGEWQEIFPDVSVVNRGINGDTTLGILHRIDSVLQVKPKKVFILIGVNDLLRDKGSNEEILARYKQIIDQLSGETTVYIQSILFTRGKWSKVNPRIIQLNQALEEYSRQNNLTYIDLNSKLAPDGTLLRGDSWDGLHLKGQGFVKWKEIISPYIYDEE